MVAQRPLEPLVLVRIQAPQHGNKIKTKKKIRIFGKEENKVRKENFAKKAKERKKEVDSLIMLRKLFRLTGEDLKKFFSQKYKKIENSIFLTFYQKNQLSYPRFALLPKKEIFKKAVKRNKIRRQIYSIIREFLKEKKIKNYDFFIIIKKDEKFLKLKESLTEILNNV